MEILSILFSSEARVKIMRLFLFNPEVAYDIDMICQKSKVNSKIARKEVSILEKSDLIKRKSFSKIIRKKKNGKFIETKKRANGYWLNNNFSYMMPLRHLLISTKTLEDEKVVKSLSQAGKLKLVAVAGVFIQDKDSRLDMLVVGNNLSKTTLNAVIKKIEAEIGRDIIYACFETPDFEYRLGMNDKLIRDVLDYPHKVILDKRDA